MSCTKSCISEEHIYHILSNILVQQKQKKPRGHVHVDTCRNILMYVIY